MDEETQLQLALSLSKEEHQQVECPGEWVRGLEPFPKHFWNRQNCRDIFHKLFIKNEGAGDHTCHFSLNYSAVQKTWATPSFLASTEPDFL